MPIMTAGIPTPKVPAAVRVPAGQTLCPQVEAETAPRTITPSGEAPPYISMPTMMGTMRERPAYVTGQAFLQAINPQPQVVIVMIPMPTGM